MTIGGPCPCPSTARSLVATSAVARSHRVSGLTPLRAGSAALPMPLCRTSGDARLLPNSSYSYGLTMRLTCVVASVSEISPSTSQPGFGKSATTARR